MKNESKTVKVDVLRTVQRGEIHLKKGTKGVELAAELAAEFSAGERPAVKSAKEIKP